MSAALHVSVAVVAFAGLPSFQKERPAPPPPIAIEFVKIAEKTQVVAPEPEPQPEEATARQQPQSNFAAEEVVAEAPSDAVPMPDAKPDRVVERPKPTPKPEVSERQRLVARVAPRTKPRPPSRLRSGRIAALIDRSIKEEQENAPRAEEEKPEKVETPKEEEAKPDLLQGLRGRIATASIMDALRQKVEQNWVFPRGAKGIETMQVTIRIYLRADGSMTRQPEFVGAGNLNDPDRAYFRVFAESARRAVQLSAPFPDAAKLLTGGQKYIDFVFNPSEFAGG